MKREIDNQPAAWRMGDGSRRTSKSLRILLTNNTLAERAGSELFLRDLAISLMKRGHRPVAYSPQLGEVAAELSQATIPVIDDLAKLSEPPDLIHGQHHLETMTAVLRFPLTPALFVCHGWMPWQEQPPVFPSIVHYVAVDDLCRERLLTTKGVAAADVSVIRNFVDLVRFPQRSEWRRAPASALIFSNYTDPNEPRVTAIRAACAREGIARVDILGSIAGNSHPNPGQVLSEYDVVFAKARCALEAMASGAAVIVTDYAGLAGLVTSADLPDMRAWNFGARTMQAAPMTEDNVRRELRRYDASEAHAVSDIIRAEADMALAIDQWLAIYDRVLDAGARGVRWDAVLPDQCNGSGVRLYPHALALHQEPRRLRTSRPSGGDRAWRGRGTADRSRCRDHSAATCDLGKRRRNSPTSAAARRRRGATDRACRPF